MTEPCSTPTQRGMGKLRASPFRLSVRCGLTMATVAVATILVASQTRFKLDTNKYTPEQDVKLGQEAAAQVAKELPMLNDSQTEEWAEQVGRVLVTAIPGEFGHPQFRYTFDVVNQKEINAFALPGGPMFLNRGMIEAGTSEAEVAGVMAHENRPRGPPSRHRAGHQGPALSDRRARGTDPGHGRRRHRRRRHCPGLAVRTGHLLPEVRAGV